MPIPIKTLFATACLAAAAFTPVSLEAAPFRPADDSEVLERLPIPDDRERRALRQQRQSLLDAPDDLPLALNLARRYLAIGRTEADPRYAGYAEAALAPWLSLDAPPPDVLVLRAIIRQGRHAFIAALEDLDQALALRPGHAQAQLSRAFILQAQGRIAEAAESCRRLSGGIDRLVAATCRARVASLSGDAAGARQMLTAALAETRTTDDGIRLWALTNLAEIAERSGDDAAAERHYQAALALERRDIYLLAAYADFLLDNGRPADVRRLLDGETGPDPLLLRLTLAEQALGDARYEDHRAALDARFRAAQRRGDQRHLREEARFALQVRGDATAGLALALDNWRTQREPADARLVLEAALAAGTPDRAAPVIRWLDETGLEDVRLAGLVARLKTETR